MRDVILNKLLMFLGVSLTIEPIRYYEYNEPTEETLTFIWASNTTIPLLETTNHTTVETASETASVMSTMLLINTSNISSIDANSTIATTTKEEMIEDIWNATSTNLESTVLKIDEVNSTDPHFVGKLSSFSSMILIDTQLDHKLSRGYNSTFVS